MKATQLPLPTLLLVLAGASVIVGDLVTPHGRSPWLEIGLGVLFLGLMSVNYELSQRRRELDRTFRPQEVKVTAGGHVAKGKWPDAGGPLPADA
ncbi:hypothetical protein FHX42_002838 [Saccharopolyspora lacisalsi]|uniref:Uncharacterized protein n=1 Tax=Halosaccharopolyspora lacisalsi TaxID=1000566 RepID=A0A839E161_9PSEU|nr:hypothetical protein [Halosaccharopolyspora lacisalsi]MBA8825487.1 hypothetical protein [Halosaccharopolyspora lacisalsi]